MKIINSTLQAVVERVTELEWHYLGNKFRLFVFQNLGQDGTPAKQWIQNWECDDVTYQFDGNEREEIFQAVNAFWKNK